MINACFLLFLLKTLICDLLEVGLLYPFPELLLCRWFDAKSLLCLGPSFQDNKMNNEIVDKEKMIILDRVVIALIAWKSADSGLC